MSAFTDQVTISPSGTLWMTDAPLNWELLREGSGLVVSVPTGFKTDLATIPWWARWLFNPEDPAYAKAAILHDFLLSDTDNSRLEAAAVFHDALKACGVASWRAVLMTVAVWAWTAWLAPLFHRLGV